MAVVKLSHRVVIDDRLYLRISWEDNRQALTLSVVWKEVVKASFDLPLQKSFRMAEWILRLRDSLRLSEEGFLSGRTRD